MYPVISKDRDVQDRYEALRRKGNKHAFAEMLALQKPPRARNTYSPMHPRKNRGRGF